MVINLFWTLLSVNLINNSIEITYVINVIIYVILIKIYNVNLLNVIILLFIVNASWICKLILISLITIFELSKLHTITWSWVVLSFFSINHSLSKWDLTIVNKSNLIDYFSLKLNNSGVEYLTISNKNYHLQDTTWGLLRNHSNTTQPTFLHLNDPYIFNQILKTFLLELSHSITILDYNTNILTFLIFLWLCYTLKVINSRQIIIF